MKVADVDARVIMPSVGVVTGGPVRMAARPPLYTSAAMQASRAGHRPGDTNPVAADRWGNARSAMCMTWDLPPAARSAPQPGGNSTSSASALFHCVGREETIAAHLISCCKRAGLTL